MAQAVRPFFLLHVTLCSFLPREIPLSQNILRIIYTRFAMIREGDPQRLATSPSAVASLPHQNS